jgi:hypothetical protein
MLNAQVEAVADSEPRILLKTIRSSQARNSLRQQLG